MKERAARRCSPPAPARGSDHKQKYHSPAVAELVTREHVLSCTWRRVATY